MSTGVLQIDNQHKELIAWLNKLVAAMSEGHGNNEIEYILSFIRRYCWRHFCTEETYMATYKCPLAASNKESHAKFVEVFDSLYEQFLTEGPSDALVIAIQHNLSEWFIRHIRRVDTQLYLCVRQEASHDQQPQMLR